MRCIIFIDGSNFYNGVKKLIRDNTLSLLYFDYIGFGVFYAKMVFALKLRYYIGAIARTGDKKSEKLYANQQRLMALLQKNNIPVILEAIIRHPDKTFHEKGVDVRIAVEMIRLARLNNYDKAILVSSDTDLVPIIEEVKNFICRLSS